MKFSIISTTTTFGVILQQLLTLQSCSAFLSHPPNSHSIMNMNEQRNTFLQMSQEPKKKLSSSDILANARKLAGLPEEEEAPELFNDDLLEDMKQSLVLLEQRIKDGPGSLSADQVLQLETFTNRIVLDMKQRLGEDVSASVVSATPTVAATPTITQQPPQAQTQPATEYHPTSDEEGSAYDGTGGMGIAKGTANTYVIPGMDEMSPEEYREKLQATVSARQSKRNALGNRASNNYLDDLGS